MFSYSEEISSLWHSDGRKGYSAETLIPHCKDQPKHIISLHIYDQFLNDKSFITRPRLQIARISYLKDVYTCSFWCLKYLNIYSVQVYSPASLWFSGFIYVFVLHISNRPPVCWLLFQHDLSYESDFSFCRCDKASRNSKRQVQVQWRERL